MSKLFKKREKTYSPQQGDTLSQIAGKECQDNITWEDLALLNWGTKDSAQVTRILIEIIGCQEIDQDNPGNTVLDPAQGPEGDKQIFLPELWESEELSVNQTHTVKAKKILPAPAIIITKLDRWFIPETETCDIDYRVEGAKERASIVDFEVHASNYCKAEASADGKFIKYSYRKSDVPIYKKTVSTNCELQNAPYQIRDWKGKSEAEEGVLKPREGKERYINVAFSPYTVLLRYYKKDVDKYAKIILEAFWPKFDDSGQPYADSLKIKWGVEGTPKLKHGLLMVVDKTDKPVFFKGLGKDELTGGEHEFDWSKKGGKDIVREANMPYRVQIQAHTEFAEDAGLALAAMHTEVRLFTHADLGKKKHAIEEPTTLKFSLSPFRPETTSPTAGSDEWYYMQLAMNGFHPGPVHGDATSNDFQKALKEFQRSHPKNAAAPFERLPIDGNKSADTQTALARLAAPPAQRPLFGNPNEAGDDRDITDEALINNRLNNKDSSLIVWVDDRHYYTDGAEYPEVGLENYRGAMSIGDGKVTKDAESTPRPWIPIKVEIALMSKNNQYDHRGNFPEVTDAMRRAIGPIRVDWSFSEPDRELENIVIGGNNYRTKTWIERVTGRAHGGVGVGIAYPEVTTLKEGEVTLNGNDFYVIPHLKKAKLAAIHVYNEAGTIHYYRHTDYFLRETKEGVVSMARVPTGRITDGQKVKVREYPENSVLREGTVDLSGTGAHVVAPLRNANLAGVRIFNSAGTNEYTPHVDFRLKKQNNGDVTVARIAAGNITDGETVKLREENVYTNCPTELLPGHEVCGGIRPAVQNDMAQYYKAAFGIEGDHSLRPWKALDDPDGSDSLNSRVCTIVHDDLAQDEKKIFPDYMGKTGIYFRPSIIAGDGYRLRAQVSFKKLPDGLDHPNQEVLNERYPQVPQAHSASMRIWRKAAVRGYVNWTSAAQPDWKATIRLVNGMYNKAFVHLVFAYNNDDPFPLTGGNTLITAQEYKDLVEAELAGGYFAGKAAVFNAQYVWPFLQEKYYGFEDKEMDINKYLRDYLKPKADNEGFKKFRNKLLHFLVKKIEKNYGFMRGHLMVEFESSPNVAIVEWECSHCNSQYSEVVNDPGSAATILINGTNYTYSSESEGLGCTACAPGTYAINIKTTRTLSLNACGLACGASWLFLPRRPDTWAHEMGHHRHMQHAQSYPTGTCKNTHLPHTIGRTTKNVPDPVAGGNVTVICGASPGAQLDQHDSQTNPHLAGEAAPDTIHADKERCWDRHCLMSYNKNMARVMCGKCILKQRGWAVEPLANPVSAIQDEP